MTDETPERFRDERVVLGGIEGETVEIQSANPGNYHEAMADPAGCEPVTVDGKLFVPSTQSGQRAVIVVPGSLGVGPNHRAHSETLLGEGHAVLLLDPFGARAVESTVANQTPYSFAASAFDVLATLQFLAGHPLIEPTRIAAQGHSRGGSAVLTAAARRFADAVVGPDLGLAAVYAAYPWCGHQFQDPTVGTTRVRAVLAEHDEWCSVQQAQGLIGAIAAAGGEATARVVVGAAHSFDRLEPVHELDDAVVAPQAPTIHLRADGAMIDPRAEVADPEMTDLGGFVAAAEAGFVRYGARIGGVDDQPDTFRDDMIAFHSRT